MSGYKCPAAKAKCADGLQCVPKKKQCDGVPQCNDGSDESKEVCPGSNITCLFLSTATALVLNRSPIIFKNLQIKSKSVKEGMNRRIFSC